MFLNKMQYITTSRINHHEPISHLKCWANIDLKVANPTDAKVALANVRAQGRVGDVAGGGFKENYPVYPAGYGCFFWFVMILAMDLECFWVNLDIQSDWGYQM